ncbi:MAG TPA: helix-turn-helix transcriptional regulator [Vicinamibacterales bacterium]|nr:helix-turn-helix transcriptional regulator [Vicinamibacterales bacterium]
MPREALGDVEHLVLLALLRLERPEYGVPILDEIERRTGKAPSRAAVYIALQRLEVKGLVRSHLGESSAERGGRARRFFQLEPKGLRQLRESRSALVRMWEDFESHLEPESGK